jgi:hypothetical protein
MKCSVTIRPSGAWDFELYPESEDEKTMFNFLGKAYEARDNPVSVTICSDSHENIKAINFRVN